MSWKIASITLPVAPKKVSVSLPRKLEVVPTMVTLPLVFDYGILTRKLKLEGKIVEAGKTAAQLETDYLNKLLAMSQRKSVFPIVVADDDQAAFWSLGRQTGASNLIDVSIADEASIVKRGDGSLKIAAVSSTVCATWFLQKTYSPAKDWSAQDFISLWWYGANSGATLRFWCGTDYANRYSFDWVDNFEGWQRFVKKKDEFSTTGSPSWSSIAVVELKMMTENVVATWYLDKVCIGVGYLLTAPDKRYDGVYALKKFEFSEEKRVVDSFEFEMELWDFDEYY